MATKITLKSGTKIKVEKLSCPVCKTKIRLTTNKKNEIIVCSTCDNSLFLHKTKKETILQPFALNLGIEGNKLIPDDDIGDIDDGLDDFSGDEFDEEDD